MHLRTSEREATPLGFGGYTCNWGAHFCALYESETERDDIMFGFLAAGLRERQLLVCCPDDRRYESALERLGARCPDCDPPKTDSFRLLRSRELYHPRGVFVPEDMLTAHENIWDDNRRAGARPVRGTADMSWAVEQVPGVEHLMAYESALNTFIWGKDWISVCLYDVNRFTGATIMKVMQTHPFVITGGGVFENPYFVRPDGWLAKHSPQTLSLL
jgi:hypothetical protein